MRSFPEFSNRLDFDPLGFNHAAMGIPLEYRTAWTRRDLLLASVLFAAVLTIFWPVCHYDFVRFDDPVYLFENPHAQHGLTRSSAHWAVTSLLLGSYIPLPLLSSLLDVSLWGMNPGPMHLENVIIHALSTAGWYLLWVRLTGGRGRSFAVAGLFGWHPMHVEAVAWIVERGDVLCMLCIVAALLAYTEYIRRNKVGFYVLSIALGAAGLLCKPLAVLIVGLLFLINIWPLQRLRWGGKTRCIAARRQDDTALLSASPKRFILEMTPFALLALAGAGLAMFTRVTTSFQSWTLSDRFANVVFGYTSYLYKAVWPEPMLVLYPLRREYRGAAVFAATALLLLLTLGAFRVRKRRPYLIVGWLWWMGTLLPSIGIVQAGSQSMADRYTYLPYVGLSVTVVWWFTDACNRTFTSAAVRWAVCAAACAVVLLASAWESGLQLRYWRNNFALYSHAAEYEPDDPLINNAMGVAYSLDNQPQLAMQAFGRSVDEDPTNAYAQTNLANMLLNLAPEHALPHFESAARSMPNQAFCWWDLGLCQQRLHDYPHAAASYHRALQLDPAYTAARQSLQSLPPDHR